MRERARERESDNNNECVNMLTIANFHIKLSFSAQMEPSTTFVEGGRRGSIWPRLSAQRPRKEKTEYHPMEVRLFVLLNVPCSEMCLHTSYFLSMSFKCSPTTCHVEDPQVFQTN